MKREINLDPYPIISRISHYDYHTLENYTSVIFECDGHNFFINDEVQKLEDVSQMPDYIKLDWIKYNRKSLGISEINKHVEFYNKEIVRESWSNDAIEEMQEYLDKLISIRRDLILKGIIS
jgi:hypothetical protein